MSAAILAWGRPTNYVTAMHAIVSHDDGGSVVTACRGRWAVAEPHELAPVGCVIADPCGACLDYALARILERGVEDVTDLARVDFGDVAEYGRVDLGTRFDFGGE